MEPTDVYTAENTKREQTRDGDSLLPLGIERPISPKNFPLRGKGHGHYGCARVDVGACRLRARLSPSISSRLLLLAGCRSAPLLLITNTGPGDQSHAEALILELFVGRPVKSTA